MTASMQTPFFIVLTLAAYLLFRRLYGRFPHPLFNVIVLSAASIITLLLLCGLSYEAYAPARKMLNSLLGPATVGLAVPLYRYRKLLVRAAPAIVGSVAAGALASMASAGLLSLFAGLPRHVVISIMPKGVSIPFAVEIAALYEGDPALAAAFVVATGTLGSLFGPVALTLFGIRAPVPRGLALGTVSHAQGTAAALQEGELPGAMGGLAMILSGMLTVLFSPLVVRVLDTCSP